MIIDVAKNDRGNGAGDRAGGSGRSTTLACIVLINWLKRKRPRDDHLEDPHQYHHHHRILHLLVTRQ